MNVFKDEPGLTWLLDPKAIQAGTNAWRPGILTELGRITDNKIMIDVARQVCTMKPAAKAGMIMVRRYRMTLEGKTVQETGNALDLNSAIVDAINGYLTRYPRTIHRHVLEAIQSVRATVEQQQEEAAE